MESKKKLVETVQNGGYQGPTDGGNGEMLVEGYKLLVIR